MNSTDGAAPALQAAALRAPGGAETTTRIGCWPPWRLAQATGLMLPALALPDR